MAANGLHLDIPGAQGDVAAMQTSQKAIETVADSLKATAAQLFGGTLRGTAANAGDEFSQLVDSTVRSSNEVVQACARVVGQASDDTIGYDQGGFAGVYR